MLSDFLAHRAAPQGRGGRHAQHGQRPHAAFQKALGAFAGHLAALPNGGDPVKGPLSVYPVVSGVTPGQTVFFSLGQGGLTFGAATAGEDGQTAQQAVGAAFRTEGQRTIVASLTRGGPAIATFTVTLANNGGVFARRSHPAVKNVTARSQHV